MKVTRSNKQDVKLKEKYKVKRLNENSMIVNLCVEVWDYYPVAFKQISSVIATFLKEEKKGIQPPTESIG